MIKQDQLLFRFPSEHLLFAVKTLTEAQTLPRGKRLDHLHGALNDAQSALDWLLERDLTKLAKQRVQKHVRKLAKILNERSTTWEKEHTARKDLAEILFDVLAVYAWCRDEHVRELHG